MDDHEKDTRAPVSVFLAAAFVIFILTLSAADSIGFVPCQIDGTCTVENWLNPADIRALSNDFTPAPEATSTPGILPARIKISAISLDLPVQNPQTRDTAILDELLQSGPARYVDSAELGQNGNMIIFAHSSHLPIIHNQMFKAFNNIPNLKAGDGIEILGDDGKMYLYSVIEVRKAQASEDEKIYLKTDTTQLTLVTCDTLTGKSARFIVEANYIGVE